MKSAHEVAFDQRDLHPKSGSTASGDEPNGARAEGHPLYFPDGAELTQAEGWTWETSFWLYESAGTMVSG